MNNYNRPSCPQNLCYKNKYNSDFPINKKESPLCSLLLVERFLCSLQNTHNIMNIYKFLK